MVVRTPRFVILLLALAMVLAACGSGAEEVTTAASEPAGGASADADGQTAVAGGCENSEVVSLIEEAEGLEGEERETFLVERAQEAGGSISLYTEMSDFELLAEAWDERYEDAELELTVYRAGSEQVRQRILEEAAAGFQGADLLEIEALEMVILGNEGILAPSSSPYAADVVEAGQFENFTADRFSYILPMWNTDSVQQAPASLEDFADGAYDNVALEDTDVYWFAVLVEHMEEQGMSREEAVDVFAQMAANSDLTHGHTTTAELVIAGQYGISPNAYLHRALSYGAEGAPVEWQPVNVPVVAEITAVSVLCSAANPAGALLLQDFFLDPEGAQSVFVELDRTPANAEKQAEQLGGIELEPLRGDVEAIVENYEEWASLWEETIRSGA
jgi:iron(III) transport system substrate-binding protein